MDSFRSEKLLSVSTRSIEEVDELINLNLSFSENSSPSSPNPATIPPTSPSSPSDARPQRKAPMAAQSKLVLSGSDRLFFRLNKLLAPTKDLASILTTFNYALYILAWLDGKTHSAKAKILSLISHKASAFSGSHVAEASPFAKMGSVFANTRATLRLFGLLPIYVKVRKLISNKEMDSVLRTVELVQCAFFGTYQALENAAFLMDHGIISTKFSPWSKWTHKGPASLNLDAAVTTAVVSAVHPRVATLYKIAHRAWFLGIMCDFARLMREAQIFFRRNHIEKDDITAEEAERAAQWYYEWIRPLAWLPIGWQLAAWTEKGHSDTGLNLGFQGVAGVLADFKRVAGLWHATRDVTE